MLDFRLASVLMSAFTSALFIVILTLIFLNESILYKFGLSILSVFCALIFIRMLLPFEFTGITINIGIPTILSRFFAYLQHPRFLIFGHLYSIWEFFVIIWGIVFFIRFLNYIRSIRKTYNFIRDFGIDVTDDYIALVKQICTKKRIYEKISVIKLPITLIPSVFRYRFHYYIVMPSDLELDEDEMELVLGHELSHVIHHDLILKFLIQILCDFYWWNPCCNILRKQSNLLFELRVDSSVTSKGPRKIQRYLACLLKIKEYNVDKENKLPPSAIISIVPKQSSTLHKRFRFLMESDMPKNKYLAGLLLLPVCVIYLMSFVFIFESYYITPSNADANIELNLQNTYAVINKQNTYDIYFNGIYAETVDSLESYPENCEIYLSLAEAQEKEKN